jgi:hypothetical protein
MQYIVVGLAMAYEIDLHDVESIIQKVIV